MKQYKIAMHKPPADVQKTDSCVQMQTLLLDLSGFQVVLTHGEMGSAECLKWPHTQTSLQLLAHIGFKNIKVNIN